MATEHHHINPILWVSLYADKLYVQLHLHGRSWCKAYQDQSQQIGLMIEKLFKGNSHLPKKLDDDFKKELQLLITTNLK